MAGVSLLSLVRRLKTVKSTKKITSAMGIVATTKYQKARRSLDANNEHFRTLNTIISNIEENIEEHNTYYFIKNPGEKKLYIVFNSVKGMVGGYNSELMGEVVKLIKTDRVSPVILATGHRGLSYINKLIRPEDLKVYADSDIPTYGKAAELLNLPLEMYKNGEVSEVDMVYTKYYSASRTGVVVEKLLPITSSLVSEKGSKVSKREFEFRPEPKMMEDKIIPMYLREKVYNTALNAKTSEECIRMRAMDSATKNADQLLNDLTRQYNRLRQTNITQEITEIVGGAEALK